MGDFPGSGLGPFFHGLLSTVGEGSVIADGACFMGQGANAAAAWPTANKAFFYPVIVPNTVTVYKLAWLNGTITTAPNVDVGIYDAEGAKLVSSGAILQAGASVIQVADITDTTIGPGTYYLAMMATGTGSQFQRTTGLNAQLCRISGCVENAAGSPLPAAMGTTAITSAYVPVLVGVYQTATF